MSLLHRVVFWRLSLVTAVTWFMLPGPPDPLLAAVLELIKIGLVVDRIVAMAARLRRSHLPGAAAGRLLDSIPLGTVLSTELAVATSALRSEDAPMAQRFLTGSVYAKTLAVGGLCLVLHGLRPERRRAVVDVCDDGWATVVRLLGAGGALVLASAPRIESESRWVARGAPLFLVVNIGLAYYHYHRRGEGIGPGASAARQPPERKESDDMEPGVEWIVALVVLVALKAAAVWLVYGLWERLRGSSPSSTPANRFVDAVVLPLVSGLVDHSTDMGIALDGHLASAWTNVAQSALGTYFFVKPLAALAGHDIDLSGGRVSLGACLVATCMWLRASHMPFWLKGAGLLAVYGCLCGLSLARPSLMQQHVL
ncbi:hypothetical protein BS50DRAFT_641202 [Corynespora cassiicola Philippines]|uniref:Sodium/calcium exchanger membrane region domain-containing protein n=1 Tax=Corynespora cassiicola Philippines TaxID=1448308 RepID=A0A2T2N1P2_CORCC|nr:hypothetical protein BS50DRAFT_641202 [Corynespora cassiicola Philippines]